jgi:hypothetical protein
LALGGGGIVQSLEMLREHECHVPPTRCIALIGACLVLSQPQFEAADSRADIVAPVSTTQNVEVSAHCCRSYDSVASRSYSMAGFS